MSDLFGSPGDHATPASPWNPPGFRPAPDRPRRPSDLKSTLVLGLLAACAGRAIVVAGAAPEPPREPEVWVDAYALPGGDGTERRPFKNLPMDLAAGSRVHLKSGLYAGPFVLPERTTLSGEGEVVLHADGPGPVVQATVATLSGLSVQGGGVGLVVKGPVALFGVHFSGHHDTGVLVEATGAVALTGCVFEGAVHDSTAVLVNGGKATFDGGVFREGWKRGLDGQNGTLVGKNLSFEGITAPVRVVGGTADLTDVSAAAGQGPAFFVTRGALTLRRVKVQGHEYGVESGEGAVVRVDGLVVRRSQLVGLALVGSDSRLSRVTVETSGRQGAMQILGGTALVEETTLSDVQAQGILVRKAKVTLRRITIDGVHMDTEHDGTKLEGDGIAVRDSTADLDDVRVSDAEGAGVLVTMSAQVTLGTVNVERAGVGGLVVERSSAVFGKTLVVRGANGPGVSVLEGSSLRLGALKVSGASDGAVWAECENGSSVRLDTLEESERRVPSPCVKVKDRVPWRESTTP